MSNQNEYSNYIDSIFQNADANGLILSSELQEGEIEIIYDFINKMYAYLTDEINQPHFLEYDDGTFTKATEIETRNYYNKQIEAILKDKEIIEEWYNNNNKYIPGTAEAIKHNKMKDESLKKAITKIKKRKEKEAKTGFPMLRKKDAFAILKKYESEDYSPTTAEKNNIIKHPNFKKYTNKYTKNWKAPFPNAVKILIEKGRISLKDFYSLCQGPNSDFFRNHFVESFKYECTNRKGRFYENKKLRDLVVEPQRIQGTTDTEPVFLLYKKPL